MVENPKIEKSSSRLPIFGPPVIRAILVALVAGVLIYTVYHRINLRTVQKHEVPIIPQVKTVTALGRLEPKGEVIKLSAPASLEGNRVEKLLVKEGDRVKPGQMIAVLDSRDRLSAALTEAQEAVRVAQVNLERVKAGAKQGEIEAHKATVARLEAERRTQIDAQKATVARLEAEQNTQIEAQKATIGQIEAQAYNAQSEYRRYQTLYEQGAITVSLRDNKGLTVSVAQQQLAEARANLKRIQTSLQQQLAEARANLTRIQTSGEQQIKEAKANLNRIAEVRPVDVSAAQAEVNHAIASMKRAQENLAQAYVHAPQEGQVFKIHAHAGELISNDGIVEMGDNNNMYAVAEVYQSDIGKVRLGQRVRLTGDSLQGELQGTVARVGLQVLRQNVINSDPSTNIDSRVVEVHVRLDNPSSEKAATLTNLQVKAVIEL
ncbi:MAG: ABC exporter membrane fusion protein [Stigonema ocellatum SAG 48.90 = DSM 106950]|nr:ABC exporter membrane fusion protein [Stigonema ocellatum SAG 48.90 = DSM 106950]